MSRFRTLVEQMRYDDPTITSIVIHQTLKHWRNTDADTVILGCTHYPLLYKPLMIILVEIKSYFFWA